jgi:hypothetical protein
MARQYSTELRRGNWPDNVASEELEPLIEVCEYPR